MIILRSEIILENPDKNPWSKAIIYQNSLNAIIVIWKLQGFLQKFTAIIVLFSIMLLQTHHMAYCNKRRLRWCIWMIYPKACNMFVETLLKIIRAVVLLMGTQDIMLCKKITHEKVLALRLFWYLKRKDTS